jgi:hypothetical protein
MNDNACAEEVSAGKYAYECADYGEKVHVLGCGENEIFFSARRDNC